MQMNADIILKGFTYELGNNKPEPGKRVVCSILGTVQANGSVLLDDEYPDVEPLDED